MDRILISLKKENGPRASSAPALGLNTIIFKHVYWYMYMQQTQVSVYRTIGPLVYVHSFECSSMKDNQKLIQLDNAFFIEPVGGKTNNLGSDQVQQKPGCTVTEDG